MVPYAGMHACRCMQAAANDFKMWQAGYGGAPGTRAMPLPRVGAASAAWQPWQRTACSAPPLPSGARQGGRGRQTGQSRWAGGRCPAIYELLSLAGGKGGRPAQHSQHPPLQPSVAMVLGRSCSPLPQRPGRCTPAPAHRPAQAPPPRQRRRRPPEPWSGAQASRCPLCVSPADGANQPATTGCCSRHHGVHQHALPRAYCFAMATPCAIATESPIIYEQQQLEFKGQSRETASVASYRSTDGLYLRWVRESAGPMARRNNARARQPRRCRSDTAPATATCAVSHCSLPGVEATIPAVLPAAAMEVRRPSCILWRV